MPRPCFRHARKGRVTLMLSGMKITPAGYMLIERMVYHYGLDIILLRTGMNPKSNTWMVVFTQSGPNVFFAGGAIIGLYTEFFK